MEGVSTRSQATKDNEGQRHFDEHESLGYFPSNEQPQQPTSARDYQSPARPRYPNEFARDNLQSQPVTRPAYHLSPPRSWQQSDDSRNVPSKRMPYELKLPRYDGQGKWRTFIRQFEAITCSWSENERLQHLLTCLKGDAADFAFDLDRAVLNNYDLLVEELHKRFHTKETRQTKVRKFYNRKLQKDETLCQFAGDLKCLIRKAYPNGLSRQVMEEMLLKQFFDGLEDEDLRYYVEYLKNPENLDEAVELVYEYDEYRNIKRETLRKKNKGLCAEEQDDNSSDEVRIIDKKSRNQSSNNRAAQSRSKSRQQADEKETESNKNGSMEKVQARLGDLARMIGDLTQLLRETYQQNKTSANICTKQESADYKVGGHRKIQDEKQDLN